MVLAGPGNWFAPVTNEPLSTQGLSLPAECNSLAALSDVWSAEDRVRDAESQAGIAQMQAASGNERWAAYSHDQFLSDFTAVADSQAEQASRIQVGGVLGFVGGIGECLGGAFSGNPVMAGLGADSAFTGFCQMLTGEPSDTVLSGGLQGMGLSRDWANYANMGVHVGVGFGPGIVSALADQGGGFAGFSFASTMDGAPSVEFGSISDGAGAYPGARSPASWEQVQQFTRTVGRHGFDVELNCASLEGNHEYGDTISPFAERS